MAPEPKSEPSINIDTGGGNYVGGDVHAGKDFVSRDKTEIGTQNNYYSTLPPTVESVDASPAPGESPYQGMEYFDVADADRFFGREQLTAELIEHLRHNPLLAIVGASGSGKSSLARAGLIPALNGTKPLIDQSQPPKGSSRWAYHIISPTSHPLESLAASLTRRNESVTATSMLIDDLRKDARSLHLAARKLVSGDRGGDQRLLLLVDQFEELFTLCKDETEQQAFVNNLLHAVSEDGVVTLVLTLRADFYHHCAKFPELRNALATQQKYIGAMSSDELRRAIEEPAKAGNWEFQEGLVEQLLNDVGDEPGALPLLSHALLETWKRRSGRRMTLAGYTASGKVQGAIAKSADEIYTAFLEPQQRIARTIFLRLTELGEGSQDTHRRVRPEELKLTHASTEEVQSVLKTLADARLVTTDDDEVQVAHEALIRAWQTLREWLDDDREGNRIQRRLTEAANQWVEYGKDANLLYRGVLLQQAQEWLKETIDPPNQVEMEFLQESQDVDKKSRRLRRFVTQVLVALTMVALLAAGAAWIQAQRVTSANNQLNQTINELDATNNQLQQTISVAFSRQLSAQSTSELSKNRYEPAILLALTAGKITDTLESYSAIRAAIANLGHSRIVFYGHTGSVDQATWNKDESKILTSSADKTARIWDAATGKQLLRLEGVDNATWSQDESKILTLNTGDTVSIWDAVTGEELVKLEGVYQATWSQDESKILTRSADNTARIWDAATGKQLLKLESVTQAIWSQDSSKILTLSNDNTARIWNAATGKQLLRLEGLIMYAVDQATWSKDESKILTLSNDNTARIWDAATGKQLLRLEDVNLATWTKDKNKILTASRDNTARIWDATTGKELLRLEGHTGAITQATWNKDESKILTRSVYPDPTARIWDAATGKELVTLQGHTGSVFQAIWSQDGSKILTISVDNTARIWDAATGKQLLRLEGVDNATWNKDESKILTSNADNTARIWDAATGKEEVGLEGQTAPVTQATWNKDESKILTSSADGTVRIWYAATGKEKVRLEGVYQATWSQDESKILTLNTDGTARIWDAATGKQLLRLERVTNATWNKDENKIFTRNYLDTARILDAATGRELIRLEGDSDAVDQATWSKDESKILTSNYGSIASIWDAATGKELVKLEGHKGSVDQAIWSQDESNILTINNGSLSYSNTASIWDAATGKELLRLEVHTGAITQATWNKDESKILTRSVYPDPTARIWDAVTGKELVRLEGIDQATWNKDESKILTISVDNTARIWKAATGKELVKLEGHTGYVIQATWNKDESKILTSSADHTARIWDAATGKELVRLEGHTGSVTQATWNKDESKILTSSEDGTVRIWYAHMKDLVVAGCKWAPRNFTGSEWSQYMADNVGNYRPTCRNAPIPPDAIEGIQEEARQQIISGQVLSGTQRLDELNGWLKENGQFDSFGIDVQAFVAEVSATATAEAVPSPTPSNP